MAIEEELREWELRETERPARQRFQEAAGGILGPRAAAFRQELQGRLQRPEGGIPFRGGSSGVVRGVDLARRSAAQARQGGAYGQAMGGALGTALAEETAGLNRFRSEQTAGRLALQAARERTAAAAAGLAGQGVSQVTALVQRKARDVKDRRSIAFNLAYSDLVGQGVPVPQAWARASEIVGFDPATGVVTNPGGV